MSRKTPPRKLDISGANTTSLTVPQPHHHQQGIAALFAITFDMRAGCTITWQQPEDFDISGVEFQSMPSGLHHESEDLIYFVRPPYAGLSAYHRKNAPENERNARMVAIGILVPATGRYGRLGRAWNHAQQLKALARLYADYPENTDRLYAYFEKYYDPDIPTSAYPITPGTPIPPRYTPKHLHSTMARDQLINRKRSISDVAAPFRGLKLSPFHPAMAFPDLIGSFGPLIFILYRAALCRKRILFLTPVPVERACHFGKPLHSSAYEVYNTSVLATIPPSVSDLLNHEPNRLRTLFNVGISDIPMLERLSQTVSDNASAILDQAEGIDEQGWVACTTDAVLALKPHLYDILVTLPHTNTPSILGSKTAIKIPAINEHPILLSSKGDLLKPTLRDLRRWRRLRADMSLPRSGPDPEFDDLAYSLTWTEFICGGLFWWATAGEAASTEDFENDEDDEYFLAEAPSTRRGTLGEEVPLLERSDSVTDSIFGVSITDERPTRRRMRSDTILSQMTGFEEADVGAMVYFHRMTAKVISSLSAIIDANELTEETTAEGQMPPTKIAAEDLMRMGLDWRVDREFVREMCKTWFGRDVVFNTPRSDCMC